MNINSTEFNPFEARLEAALHPVHPSRKFVQSMRQRIETRAPVEVARRRLNDPPALLLILGGVLSVSLLIITAARAFFYLANRSKI